MRVGALVAIGLLLLPVGLSAQRSRVPGILVRRPRPAELPPQPAAIQRDLAYKRLPLSIESYPLISHVVSSGFSGPGAASSWTTFGGGTRADYRVGRNVSLTLDVTSSFAGGPMDMETAELGMRLRPDPSKHRIYPFADLRFGYAYAYHTFFSPTGNVFASPIGYGTRFSQGFGGVGGLGMEVGLTRRFSFVAGTSVMRSGMKAFGYENGQPTDDRYTMTSYRYTVGVKYNPVRLIRESAANTQ